MEVIEVTDARYRDLGFVSQLVDADQNPVAYFKSTLLGASIRSFGSISQIEQQRDLLMKAVEDALD